MARGRKKKEKIQRVIKIKASEFRDAVNEASRLKEQSSSYNGFHGTHVKNFVERTGFSRQAFGVISKMEKLGDDLKRQSLMDEIVMGFEMMGYNDQGNLFDRVSARMANDVEEEKETDSDDDTDLRPPFLQNAVPLDEAEQVFAKNAKAHPPKSAKPDALADLAAVPDAPVTH